jgi:hypothetical protein
MKLNTLSLFTAIGLFAVAGCFNGCAPLQPGADPLVVRAEQLQTTAAASFDAVLGTEGANFGFWRTNAPGFFQFCESLKQPVVYDSPEFGPTNVQRFIAAQLELDDAKTAYKADATGSSSNRLAGAADALQVLLQDASGWLAQTTTKAAPAASAAATNPTQ